MKTIVEALRRTLKERLWTARLAEHQLGGRIAGGKYRSGNFEERGGRKIDPRRFRSSTFWKNDVSSARNFPRNFVSAEYYFEDIGSRTGIKQDGKQARRDQSTTGKPEIGRNPNFEHQNGSRKIFGIDRGSEICRKDKNQTNGPRSTRWLGVNVQNVVSTVQQAGCLQKLEVSPCMEAPDIWEDWWCHACVLAMLKDKRSTRCRRACVRSNAKRHTGCHQPEADWLLSPINTPQPQLISSHPDVSKLCLKPPREGYVQLKFNQVKISSDENQVNANSVQSTILYDCDAEALSRSVRPRQSVSSMIKWRYCPELVQFHGFRSVEVLLDTPPRSSKNCPEPKGSQVVPWVLAKSSPINQLLIGKEHCSLGKDDRIAGCWTLGPPV
ncbi:hypothetical protein DY000_02008456 [Brassica cretica]|uniref:Uncharacterized protein n=1 Tax=Brassica cretica TaxID=69181 RepID=A0ABQ7C5U6_BRACR|nr:hypothetical protein DY000_02008456 [Brassica cretica]